MRVVGRNKLTTFAAKHTDARQQISAWIAEVESAEWQKPQDIKDRYPTASILAGDSIIFNLKGNKYRLEVQVSFQNKVVLVKRVGTHEQYDRWPKRRGSR